MHAAQFAWKKILLVVHNTYAFSYLPTIISCNSDYKTVIYQNLDLVISNLCCARMTSPYGMDRNSLSSFGKRDSNREIFKSWWIWKPHSLTSFQCFIYIFVFLEVNIFLTRWLWYHRFHKHLSSKKVLQLFPMGTHPVIFYLPLPHYHL